MQATEILFSLGGRLVHVMCLFICIVIKIIIVIYFYFYFFCITYYIHAVQRAIDGKTSAWLTVMPIAVKWEKSHSEVMGWVRARMAFAILRATNLCLRGSRVKWRSGHGMNDGAGLPHFPH